MRNIIFTIITLALLSCQGKESGQQTSTDKPSQEKTAEEPAQMAQTETDSTSDPTSANKNISLTGVIAMPPKNKATVSLSMSGIVRSTDLIAGAYLRKGEIIATLENPEFIDLQQVYLESAARMQYLQSEYERQQKLTDQNATTKKRLEESRSEYLSMKSRKDAAAAQLQLLGVNPEELRSKGISRYLEVRSPLNGYVTSVEINPGKYVSSGTPICEIIDKSQIMLRLTAYEKDIPYISIGDPVEFNVNGMPGKTFKGKVVSIGQQIGELNRSMDVYASVSNAEHIFRPGMYVTATVNAR